MTSEGIGPANHAAPSRIALGIVTYNNPPEQLTRLLISVDKAAGRLDDGRHEEAIYSIDCGETAHWTREGIEIPLHRLAPRGNLGFGGGMNCLMAEAFADPSTAWFICVNPDGICHREMLVEMLRQSEQYPDSLIEARMFPEEHPKPYDPETGKTLWATGACLLIPRRIYEKIGGFDTNMFMYIEDVDYSWRARAAGFDVRVAPRALFAHTVLGRTLGHEVMRFYFFSGHYLASKWHNPEMQASLAQIIRERQYFEGGGVPPLPPAGPLYPVPLEHAGVAEFSYHFAYSPRRW